MEKEIFCSNEYKVSDDGYVIGKYGKKLKGSLSKNGYLTAHLMIDGKRREISVHILVARAFCDGYKEGLYVNHKNGNKQDNRASNLEFVTPSENTLHAEHVIHTTHHPKGSDAIGSRAVEMIDVKTNIVIHKFESISEAAKYLGATKRNDIAHKVTVISRAVKGLRKTAYGYKWKYCL